MFSCRILYLFFFLVGFANAQQNIIINDVEWPPYFFVGDKNEQQGLAKELLNICVPQTGYKIDYRRLPVKNTQSFMATGKIDLTVYSYRQQREAFLYYANETLFTSEYGFMVRADSAINITELNDLAPYKMGHLAGLTYIPELMQIINDKAKAKQLVVGYNLTSMFSQLLASSPRFDIIADAKITFYWQAKMLGVSDKIKVLDYNIKHKDYFITVSKNSKNIREPLNFLADFDDCLRSLKESGQYQTILADYGAH
jgi:ABC-type amino acid transport substrate-binding protein